MKKGLKKLVVLAMAGVMTTAPVMTASAVTTGATSGAATIDQTPLRERLRTSFPSITDAHLNIIFNNWGYSWQPQDTMRRWASLSQEEKESVAYLCVLTNEDIYMLWTYGHSTLISCDRNACVNAGADAAELDSLIAKVTGQGGAEAPATAATAPTWKQDSKGWWVERPDGSYLVNEWFQSPESGLWYYMGADGYMLTNTTTPDGYAVNADGVWVQ